MNAQERFYSKVCEVLQNWISIESEFRALYAVILAGANPHIISATFYEMQSVQAKLGLLNHCFVLLFPKESEEYKRWKGLYRRSKKGNEKRNKIVHEPVIYGFFDDMSSFHIAPSYSNSLPLAKGHTTHDGPVIDPSYSPSKAKLRKENEIDYSGLCKLQSNFETLAQDLRNFVVDVSPKIERLYENTRTDS